MGSLKESFTEYAFNEDDALARIRSQHASKLSVQKRHRKDWLTAGLAAAVLMLLLIGVRPMFLGIGLMGTGTASQPAAERSMPFPLAHAVVSIDINPSFEIYIDDQDRVLGVLTLNSDAERLDVSSLTGRKISEAILKIIHLADDAGFIDNDSQTENLVLVSTVILDIPDGQAAGNQERLDQRIGNSLLGQQELDESVTIAVISATGQERSAARQNGMSLGMLIVNSLSDSRGRTISVKEFMDSSEVMEMLARRSAFIVVSKAEGQKNQDVRPDADGNDTWRPTSDKVLDGRSGSIPTETETRTGSGSQPQPSAKPEKKEPPSESRKPTAPISVTTPSSFRSPAVTGTPSPGATSGTTRTTEGIDDDDDQPEDDDDQPE